MTWTTVFLVVALLQREGEKAGDLKLIGAWEGNRDKSSQLFQFSPDGRMIVAGVGVDGDEPSHHVFLLDARTGREKTTFGSFERSVVAATVSADGKLLAATDARGKINVWDIATGKETASITENECYLLNFASDGRTLIGMGGKLVCCWAVADGKQLSRFRPLVSVQGAAVSRDGKTVAWPDHQDLDLWDAGTGKIRRTFADHRGEVVHAAFSADGKTVAAAILRNRTGNKYHWEVKLYEAENGKERTTISSDIGNIKQIALDDLAQTLLVIHHSVDAYSSELRVYDLSTGRERCRRQTLHWHAHAAISPDGKLLAISEPEKPIRIWEIPSAKENNR